MEIIVLIFIISGRAHIFDKTLTAKSQPQLQSVSLDSPTFIILHTEIKVTEVKILAFKTTSVALIPG